MLLLKFWSLDNTYTNVTLTREGGDEREGGDRRRERKRERGI